MSQLAGKGRAASTLQALGAARVRFAGEYLEAGKGRAASTLQALGAARVRFAGEYLEAGKGRAASTLQALGAARVRFAGEYLEDKTMVWPYRSKQARDRAARSSE